MNTRPSVPINVKRALWAESCGHCMNPECAENLISDDKTTSIGEMAHIVPDSEGGDVSFDNLILLCSNCHIRYEPLKNPDINVKETLRKWKRDASQRNTKMFATRFASFYLLRDAVKPLIEENYQIFKNYGPNTDDPEAYKLWQIFEPTLIANSAKLSLMFQNNIRLFQIENQEIIKEFMAHANEFEVTRDGHDGVRQMLFPEGLLSLFDIEEELIKLPPSVNALQNLIKKLQDKNQFISLSFFPDAILTYQVNKEIKKLNLKNYAKVQQLFFSQGCYFSKKTDLRLDGFCWILERISEAGKEWSFDDYSDLSLVTINDRIKIKFFYSYILSVEELTQGNIDADYITNLHTWNNAPIASDALELAESMNLEFIPNKVLVRFFYKLRF